MLDLRAVVRAPLYVSSPIQKYMPNPGSHLVDGGLILIDGGVPDLDYRCAAVVDELPVEDVLSRAATFFGGGPFSIMVEAESAPVLAAELLARGWQLDEEEPALALVPIPSPDTYPETPSELTIELVSTEAQLADFRAITRTPPARIPSLQAATDAAVALLVGYVSDAPVATARLTCCGPVAEILGVVTLPDRRRRGYGAALTWAAIDASLERGCAAATLTATEMGFPLYRRMGFVPVCTYRTYLPPPAGSDEG